jgi:hypothetical protein
MSDSEVYKGYEILLHETDGWWTYDILGINGYRHPSSYDSRDEALEAAKKAIDHLPNP